MTTPDDTNEWRSASSGATRTPPPRTRRGTPATRTASPSNSSFDDLDALDDLLLPEQKAALVEEPMPEAPPAKRGSRSSSSTRRSTSSTGTRGAPPAKTAEGAAEAAGAGAATRSGPKPAPGTAKTFDWEADDAPPARPPTGARSTTTNRDATVLATAAAAEIYGDPVEPEIAFEPTPAQRPSRKAAKRPERRFRQTVQKVDLWSVTKMALCFYVSAMGVMVVSIVALWVVADSAGIIDNVENFIGDLFSSEDFQFVSGQVLRGAVLVGVVLVALLVAFTIIAASFYNIFAELFGGVEIVIREEEQPPKR
ncbi:MAG: hypothetical protein FJW95_09400 [Actinobacteria bacterium]|nr:hypothetical protein [Actinomycetota bacterium]